MLVDLLKYSISTPSRPNPTCFHPTRPIYQTHSKHTLSASSLFQANYPLGLTFDRLSPPKPFNATMFFSNFPWAIKRIFTRALLNFINQSNGGIETLILPALKIFKKHREKIFLAKMKFCANPGNAASPVSFYAADGTLIDAMIIWNNPQDYQHYQANKKDIEPFKNNKWVIFFNGNAMCYEQILSWAKDYSQNSGCNLLLFNYRGVVESQGYPQSASDLILDGDAAFQFLLDKVDSPWIAIHGLSLGGGVGTQVRALHPDGPIANEKSFSSIAGLVEGLVYSEMIKNRYPKMIAQIFSRIVGSNARNVLMEAKWELNSLEKWAKIEGHKWIISGSEDALMRGKGKLYQSLKHLLIENNQSDNFFFLKEKIKQLNHIKSIGTDHCDPITPEAQAEHFKHLKKAFDNF